MTLILSGTDGLSDVDGSAATPAIRGTDANTGVFFPAADTVGIATSGVERLRTNSSGNVTIGKTDITTSVDGFAVLNSGETRISCSANDVLNLNRNTSNGAIQRFFRAGSLVGQIEGATTGLTYTGINGLTFTASQTASADANTLDDYEEGNWTPTLTFGGSSTGITYSTQNGTYTKVGRLVSARAVIILTNKGSASGTANITGLPFTPVDGTTTGRTSGSIYMGNGTGLANLFLQLLILSDGSNRIDLNWFNGTADGNVTNSNCTNNTYIVVSLNYFAN